MSLNNNSLIGYSLTLWTVNPWFLKCCTLAQRCFTLQVSCVSGAQLSNYATFLVHPEQAPLSIVLTALSTAAGVFMTPVLALLLLGARIPVDARGMALSITQIVLVPVLAGDSSSYTSGIFAKQYSLSRKQTTNVGVLKTHNWYCFWCVSCQHCSVALCQVCLTLLSPGEAILLSIGSRSA